MNNLPALETAVRNFENSIGFFTWCVLGSTFVVAVGLIFEYWHPVSDFVAELKWPMAIFRWAKFMEIAGGILITIGVVGEFGFTLKVFRLEGQLEQTNHAIRDILTKGLADADTLAKSAASTSSVAISQSQTAIKSAGEAQQKAGAAEASAGRAVSKSESAASAASGAFSESQQLRADLRTTEQALTDEHNKRMELEKSLTPRQGFPIKYENHKAVLPDLTGFNGIKFDDIKFDVVVIHDAEAERAAGAIIGLLTAAGWTRGSTSVVEYGTPATPQEGVSISWFLAPHMYDASIPETLDIERSWMKCEAAGFALIVFLQDHDWEAGEAIDLSNNVHNTVTIKIGFKPSPYFFPPEMNSFKETEEKFRNEQRKSNKERLQDAKKQLKEEWDHPFWLWASPH